MTAPTFYFTTYLTRGRYEREIEVEAEYTIEYHEVTLLEARDLTDGGHIESDYEWDSVYCAACDRAEEDYAEWLADYGEYLNDLRDYEREAA